MAHALLTGQGVTPAWRRLADVLLWTLVLCTCVAKFVPFQPDLPSGGLDASWRFAMSQATAMGLHFGTDVIFTFGPYAPVYTRLYHPATDVMMLSASLYLALAYWLAGFLALRRGPRHWVLGYVVFMAGALYFPDPLLFSLPLLLGLTVLGGVHPDHGWLLRGKRAPVYLALLFAPLGLLPLVKGSLLVLCCAVALLCAALFVSLRQRLLAAACLLGPLTALLLFWMLAGQPVGVLPAYLTSMLPIIAGYTEAMAYPGVLREAAAFLIASAVLAWAIGRHPFKALHAKVFLGALYAVYLFLAFKAGFVRHDGHAAIAASALVLAALALPLVLRSRLVIAGVALSLLAWVWIDYHYMHTSASAFAGNVSATYRGAWNGAALRLSTPAWPRNDYDAAVQALRAQAGLPRLPGSTDIYAYQQSDLIASGNQWSPRPVMQSYSAYTPALAELNRQHLLGPGAPDNVVFRVETIDGRLPALDDGASWPALLAGYRPVNLLGDAVLLRKTGAQPVTASAKFTPLAAGEYRFGEKVAVPAAQGRIFVQMDIKPSLLGRLAGLLFRTDRLQLTVKLQGGESKTFRLVSGMSRAGFILSPLVENNNEFLMLYGDNALLDQKRIESISLGTSSGKTLLWTGTYRVSFGLLPTPTPAPVDVAAMLNLDHFAAATAPLTAGTAQCEGVIDSINGGPPAGNIAARGVLRMQGWLTLLPAPRHTASQLYVVLTDAEGRRQYAPARAMQRPDVAGHFNQADLAGAGYSLYADVSALHGAYTLGLAVEQDGKLAHCERYRLPIKLEQSAP